MVELADMKLFVEALNRGSLSAAGRELGISPAVASKRLTRIEAHLGVRLLQRSSRRMALTEEGILYLERCRQILADIDDAENLVASGKRNVRGALHVSCPVALGRRWIGPALAAFATEWPELRVRLSLSDAVVDLLDSGFDCAIRIGGAEDSRLVARKLADNRRIICASTDYLTQYGIPTTPDDLQNHRAIVLSPHLIDATEWRLTHTTHSKTLVARIPVRMATDNGEQAHDWALAGMGLIRRSIWDVQTNLHNGELQQVLPEWHSDDAPIRILFPTRQFLPARTRSFIDFLVDFFDKNAAH
ncbi:MAG TPA: LysR family transcriptional regulator [Cellvibrio sp.]|nr:LysR family transcriptional regulator [Cellvibrio sp.]